ncbi:MAG TPA: ARMT1-like domain-containing protein [Thermotogota bacterium]|nr:ARMT1-like domain-containing protein [Thermotogota bacterium]
MYIFPDCIPCHFNQLSRIIKSLNITDEESFVLYKKVAEAFSKMENNITPVEMADILYTVVEEQWGVTDVFCEEKRQANQMAMKIVRDIEKESSGGNWPLKTYAKLAALGNQIDLGAHEVNLERFEQELLDKAKALTFALDAFESFEHKLKNAKTVLFILDNAGEVVFDRLFMKKIKETHPNVDLYAAVRGRTILNDVTVTDAEYVGLREVSQVINSGSMYPGIVIGKTSQAFSEIYNKVDLIISKGQGNFEGLSSNANERLFFCLMVKCDTISKYIGIPKGSTVFSNAIKIK